MSRVSNVPESLLKYETPILVSSNYKSQGEGGEKKPKKLAPVQTQQQRSEDYLNKILPPQEIHENGQMWVRYVSSTPATTFDVTNLAKDLDKRIIQMEARDCGICSVREEIYA